MDSVTGLPVQVRVGSRLLALQQSAGNRATAAVLGGWRSTATSPKDQTRAAVQREEHNVPMPTSKPMESLEAIAARLTRLIDQGYKQNDPRIHGGFPKGPVLSVVRDSDTGRISVGLNTGVPQTSTTLVKEAVAAHNAAITAGKVKVVHTEAIAPKGGHAEVVALNDAVRAREAHLGRTLKKPDARVFELHNVWLKGQVGAPAARCEHCSGITQGITVTTSLYIAETTNKYGRSVGKPPSAPTVATPGFKAKAGTVLGFGAQAVQARQVSNLQAAEIAKFEKRAAELQPKIDAFRAEGKSVEVILVVEAPKTFDFACKAGLFCDQRNLVYYRDLYINRVTWTVKQSPKIAPASPNRGSTMGPAGGRDSYAPRGREGGSVKDIDEKDIPHFYSPKNKTSHHIKWMSQNFDALPSIGSTSTSVRPSAPATRPKPVDEATQNSMAAKPSVYLVWTGIVRYKTAYALMMRLEGRPHFGAVKESTGIDWRRKTTVVFHWSDRDRHRALQLLEFVRAEGLPNAYVERTSRSNGDETPGSLQVNFGSDAESTPAARA